MDINSKTVSKRIVSVRKELGLKSLYVAKKLNLSESAYSKREAGEIELSIDFINTVAKVFNVSVFYLFGLDKGVHIQDCDHAQMYCDNATQNNYINNELLKMLQDSLHQNQQLIKMLSQGGGA